MWNLRKNWISDKIKVDRPKENELYQYKDHQMEVVNYAPEHVLNTPGALKR